MKCRDTNVHNSKLGVNVPQNDLRRPLAVRRQTTRTSLAQKVTDQQVQRTRQQTRHSHNRNMETGYNRHKTSSEQQQATKANKQLTTKPNDYFFVFHCTTVSNLIIDHTIASSPTDYRP